jgi:hypothetical protein
MRTKWMSFTNKMLLLVAILFTNVNAFAQEEATKVISKTTTTTNTSQWYASPWAWVIGAAIFILIFTAILRGGSRRTDA